MQTGIRKGILGLMLLIGLGFGVQSLAGSGFLGNLFKFGGKVAAGMVGLHAMGAMSNYWYNNPYRYGGNCFGCFPSNYNDPYLRNIAWLNQQYQGYGSPYGNMYSPYASMYGMGGMPPPPPMYNQGWNGMQGSTMYYGQQPIGMGGFGGFGMSGYGMGGYGQAYGGFGPPQPVGFGYQNAYPLAQNTFGNPLMPTTNFSGGTGSVNVSNSSVSNHFGSRVSRSVRNGRSRRGR